MWNALWWASSGCVGSSAAQVLDRPVGVPEVGLMVHKSPSEVVDGRC